MDLHTRLIRKNFAVLLMLVSGVAWGAAYRPQRVVYDVDSGAPAKWAVVLNNIGNHLQIVGASHMHLVLVLHGDGVNLLARARTDVQLNRRLLHLLAQGVHIRVSQDALAEHGLHPDDIADPGHWMLVKSGAAEIVHLEREGYFYIKP